MRLFVMHDGLRDHGGHMYTESLGWVRGCRERGIDLELFAHRDAHPMIVEEIGARPLFGPTEDDVARFRPPGDDEDAQLAFQEPLYMWMVGSRQIARGCRQAWDEASSPPDAIVFPFSSPAIMNGAAEWLAETPAAQRPRLLFNFPRPEHSWVLDEARQNVSGDFDYFRFGARRLRALSRPGALVMTAVDARLCHVISTVARVDCRPAPLHHFYPSEAEIDALRPAQRGGGLKISILGPSRAEKGSAMLAQTILAVCARRPEADFFVQVGDGAEAKTLSDQLGAGGAAPRVLIQPGPVRQETFFRRMLGSDLILLPYTGASYGMMPSGIFADAVVCGVPVVAPAGSWVADRLAEGWGAGELFGTAEPAEIAAATSRAAERLPQLSALAASQNRGWRKVHSLDAYIDHILPLLGG